MKFVALASSLFAALAAAQTPAVSMAMAPAAAAGAPAGTQTVLVGGSAGLVFSPANMVATPGTQVDFIFLQKNHSVVQSTLQQPCKKKVGGFDSGFNPNAAGSIVNAPKFSVTVNDSQPIWVYCKQMEGAHCGHSMVMAINANPDITAANSFQTYQNTAIQQNGTSAGLLQQDSLVNAQQAQAAAVASTVTVGVGGAAAAAATSSAGGVASGSGTGASGETCTCSCMCQPGSVPRADAVGNFGGWAGMLP